MTHTDKGDKGRDHIGTEGFKFFLQIERHFAIPHGSNYTATKRKVCLGPHAKI